MFILPASLFYTFPFYLPQRVTKKEKTHCRATKVNITKFNYYYSSPSDVELLVKSRILSGGISRFYTRSVYTICLPLFSPNQFYFLYCNKNSQGCLARSRLTAFRVLLMCLQHNRKSAPASARSRWTLHQEPYGLVSSQTPNLISKTKPGKSRVSFCNKKLPEPSKIQTGVKNIKWLKDLHDAIKNTPSNYCKLLQNFVTKY